MVERRVSTAAGVHPLNGSHSTASEIPNIVPESIVDTSMTYRHTIFEYLSMCPGVSMFVMRGSGAITSHLQLVQLHATIDLNCIRSIQHLFVILLATI